MYTYLQYLQCFCFQNKFREQRISNKRELLTRFVLQSANYGDMIGVILLKIIYLF